MGGDVTLCSYYDEEKMCEDGEWLNELWGEIFPISCCVDALEWSLKLAKNVTSEYFRTCAKRHRKVTSPDITYVTTSHMTWSARPAVSLIGWLLSLTDPEKIVRFWLFVTFSSANKKTFCYCTLAQCILEIQTTTITTCIQTLFNKIIQLYQIIIFSFNCMETHEGQLLFHV